MKNSIYEIKKFSLDNNSLMVYETIFHNANGYIGVRSNFEEGYKDGFASIRGSYINGFYDIVKMPQAEKLYGFVDQKQTIINVADIQGVKLKINGTLFSMFQGEVINSSRKLDMSKGVTYRTVLWKSPKGEIVDISIKRMTSFTKLNLFTIEYSVKAINFSGEIAFEPEHKGDVKNYFDEKDPRLAAEEHNHIIIEESYSKEKTSFIFSKTVTSNLKFATAVRSRVYIDGVETTELKNNVGKNSEVKLIKYCLFADEIRCKENLKSYIENLSSHLTKLSIKSLYIEQENYLKEYWKTAAVEIEGDDDLAIATMYNLYQLIQSVGKDEHSNIGAKGISGEGYEGHYFWDTEMYVHPFFVLTHPQIAKNLISYRYKILDNARHNARVLGHKTGALYPWRTISGEECSGYYVSGGAQYHINGDIAHSIVDYYLATNDIDFIGEKGGEIIFETARLWLDVGTYVNDTFQIHEVTGPDEYTCLVNNNYFTNACAKYNLYWAVKFYELLKENNITDVIYKINLTEEEVKSFAKAEEKMYLPIDEKLGINPQDDSFLMKKKWDIKNTPKENFPLLLNYHPLYIYRHQVLKQADTVLSHFVFEDYQDIEVIRKSFEYYEDITTHDSSLSTSIYSIIASKLGDMKKAYNYFGDSALLDLFNTHKNTKDGIHTANMAGNYMVVVYGFAGLRLKEDGLYLNPNIPDKWNSYKFTINYKKSKINFEILKECVIVTLIEGDPIPLCVKGKRVIIDNKKVISINGND